MPPIKKIAINLESSEGIIKFKNWLNKTFSIGTELYFHFYRIEDLTDDDTLHIIEPQLSRVFNEENFHTLFEIRSGVFGSIFKTKVDLHTANLIIDFWKYFYAISFFSPINDLTFEEFEEYALLEVTSKNELGKKWMWDKLTDRVYIKNLGGEELIISSYSFNI